MNKLSIGVIGLGKFGFGVAQELQELGHNIVAIDSSEMRVNVAQNTLDNVYQADAKNAVVLQELGFQDLDCVVVSVGSAMESSLIITLNLQDMHIPDIRVKACNEEHQKILHRLGIKNASLPERDAASMLAQKIANPGILDIIPHYGGIVVQEYRVENWVGKTLIELDLMNKSGVLAIATRKKNEIEWGFVPKAHEKFEYGDGIILVGKQENMQNVKP